MTPAEIVFCLALGVPADTPSYSYAARHQEISICVGRASDIWLETGDAALLGQFLDVQAKCLSYCER